MFVTKYYKNKYMLAFYDKEELLRYLFNNVAEVHESLGLKTIKEKNVVNSSICHHLKGRSDSVTFFGEPMTIELIDIYDNDEDA